MKYNKTHQHAPEALGNSVAVAAVLGRYIGFLELMTSSLRYQVH